MVNSIYLENGYIDMGGIIDNDTPYNAITGARGTGKTYGALLESYKRHKKIIYLRRRDNDLDIISAAPDILYQTINRDYNINIVVENRKGLRYIFDKTNEDNPVHIGYCAALTTFKGLRSVDLSDIEILIYDEFCGDADRPIKNEDMIFLNLLETVGRNRELQGRQPLKVILMANSINLENAIFRALNLIQPAIKLMLENKIIWSDPARGVTLYNVFNSPISQQKENTSLYRMIGDNNFRDMALYNKYTQNDLTHVKSQNLKNYTYIIRIGELHVYRSRSGNKFYVSAHAAGTPRDSYTASEHDLKRMRMALAWLVFAYYSNDILFEAYELEIIFKNYYGIK